MAKNAALFLRPEPPLQAEISEQVFVDREDEFVEAKEQLQDFLAQPQQSVLAVVGRSRVGKSHFLQRLVADVRSNFHACVNVSMVQKLPDAKVVLRNILAQLVDELELAWARCGRVDPIPLQDFYALHKRMSPLIEGEAEEITFSDLRGTTAAIQHQLAGAAKVGAKGRVGLPPWLKSLASAEVEVTAEVSASYSDQRGATASDSISQATRYKACTERQLCDLIGIAHALVRAAFGPTWRTLIVVDDFDLLTISSVDGALNPWPLLDGLHQLSQWEGLFVLSTVREDTWDVRAKTFQLLCHIPPFHDEAQLVEVYQRHVAAFREGAVAFHESFIAEAARSSDGKVGVFLDILYRAWRHASTRRRLSDLSLAAHMDEVLLDLEKALGQALYAQIVEAAKTKGGEITASVGALRASSAMRVLMDEYSTLDRLCINPAYLAHLRRKLATPG